MKRTFLIAVLFFVSPAWAGDDRYQLGDGGASAFYAMPVPKSASAGTLLKQQPLEDNLRLPDAAKAIRFLYTSTSGLQSDKPVAVSGQLFLPKGKPPRGGWPLLSWSHGTVGIADHCAPSFDGYPDFHQDYLTRWLAEGFAIVASDYEGLGTKGTHPYLATKPAAYSNLDAIRAVQSSGFPVSKDVFLLGQSQGAAAALASAGHAQSYAPGVRVSGVIATGIPFFTPKALLAVRDARPTDIVDPQLGYNFLALSLVQLVDTQFSMDDYLSDKARPIAKRISKICNRDMRKVITREKLTYDNSFTASPNAGLEKAFKLMQYPKLKLNVPIFIGSGALDKDTPLRMQMALVRRLCAAGSTVESKIYKDEEHLSALTRSLPDAISFVTSLRGGQGATDNCADFPLKK